MENGEKKENDSLVYRLNEHYVDGTIVHLHSTFTSFQTLQKYDTMILQPTLRPPAPHHHHKRPHSDIISMDHHRDCSTKTKRQQHAASGKHDISVQHADSSNRKTASSSSGSCIVTSAFERIALKNGILSPQDYFMATLQSRGYPATTYCSLNCAYHNSPTVSRNRMLP